MNSEAAFNTVFTFGWTILPLIFLGFFVWVIYYSIQKNKKRLELLKQVAPSLGLTFNEGVQKTRGSFPWELAGRFQGCDVSIYMSVVSRNKHTYEYTHFDITIPTTRQYKLNISTEGIGTKIKKFFTRKEDIATGDEAFDTAYLIESDSPDQAKNLLSKPEVRETIRAIFGMSEEVTIEDNVVKFCDEGSEVDQNLYREKLEKLVPLVKKLGDKELTPF